LESVCCRAVQNHPPPDQGSRDGKPVPNNAAVATTGKERCDKDNPGLTKMALSAQPTHSQAITAAASPSAAGNQGDPNQIAAIGSGPSTSLIEYATAGDPTQREPTDAPYRRSRPQYSSIACSRSFLEKSGHRVLVNTSSE